MSRSLGPKNAYLAIESTGESRRDDLYRAMYALQNPPLIWLMDISKTYRRGKANEKTQCLYKVVSVDTRMSALEILRYIQGIESTLKRTNAEKTRRVKRTRIYLLLYERAAIDQQDLTVPHPSVLLSHNLRGLADIDPDLKIRELSVEALMRAVDVSDIEEADDEV